jgi:hypothetical protein
MIQNGQFAGVYEMTQKDFLWAKKALFSVFISPIPWILDKNYGRNLRIIVTGYSGCHGQAFTAQDG